MIPSPKQISTPTPDIASNASISMFANMFYLVSRLILPPMILAHVSLAEYGLWSACCVLLMYIGLTDAGFSNVYVRYTARYHAQGDTDSINKLLSTGVLTLSAVALVLLCAIWFVIPHLLSLLNVSVDQTTNCYLSHHGHSNDVSAGYFAGRILLSVTRSTTYSGREADRYYWLYSGTLVDPAVFTTGCWGLQFIVCVYFTLLLVTQFVYSISSPIHS